MQVSAFFKPDLSAQYRADKYNLCHKNNYHPRDSKMLKMNKINIVMLQKKVTT